LEYYRVSVTSVYFFGHIIWEKKIEHSDNGQHFLEETMGEDFGWSGKLAGGKIIMVIIFLKARNRNGDTKPPMSVDRAHDDDYRALPIHSL
jgi:hypothetical protein